MNLIVIKSELLIEIINASKDKNYFNFHIFS